MSKMETKPMNRVMVVTGASRGLGAAVGVLAGQRGYDVCVNYLNGRERAEQVVEAIRAAGRRAIAVRADVAREADVEALFKTVDAELGPVDVLVNNAGWGGKHGRVDALTNDEIKALFELNVNGTMLCSREAIRRMSTLYSGIGGSIVNLSSAAARLGAAGRNVYYAASKGAINALTNGLAREVAAEGIRVNAVSPGVIDTDSQSPGRVAEMAPTLPMRRAGQAEEVANAVLWLASDEASYVTGTILDVSGAR
jgi:NAD(P)-dependent dehydrogenase (short-subunit alcohol dehydrogenase family)